MLKIQDLKRFYDKVAVLDGLNIEIKRGEIYGLLGENGAGKTTTINCLCGLLAWQEGAIFLNDQPLHRKTQSLIGICPQENLLYRSLSCQDNLWFYGRLYGLSKVLLRERINWCLEAVNLSDKRHWAVETLSGGMQRRLNIAVSLIHQPQLLILDEPTTGLDLSARYQIWQLIEDLNLEGMTILLTTHLLEEAEKLCHQIGILKGGKIIAQGSLNDLKSLISAQEIITLKTPQELEAIARIKELGFVHRYYGKNLAFWLPQSLSLKEILELLEPIKIDALTKQPVGLEHIFLELNQSFKRD